MFKFMCQPPSALRPTLAFLQGDAVNTDSGSDAGTANVSDLRLNAHTNAAVADPPFPVRVWLPPLAASRMFDCSSNWMQVSFTTLDSGAYL